MIKIQIVLALIVLVSLTGNSLAQANDNYSVEKIVRGAFSDMPDMIKIAQCESGFRQYAPDGSVLRGSVSRYVGIFQIDENIHTQPATGLSFDIQTVEGNIGYARYLYLKSGPGPWKDCGGNASSETKPNPVVANNTSTNTPVKTTPTKQEVVVQGSLNTNLNIGMVNPQVLLLQQILNKIGFAVAESGPGSQGFETTKFGALTREAVRKLQCAKGLTCEGDESTTGYGRVGPRTLQLLNQLNK